MSWSLQVVGKPDAIIRELDKHSDQLKDQCKVEFDAVKPGLVCLVEQNYVSAEYVEKGAIAPTLMLTASGHGGTFEGRPQYGTCQVKLESFHTKIVT